jgi:hypothetical protein
VILTATPITVVHVEWPVPLDKYARDAHVLCPAAEAPPTVVASVAISPRTPTTAALVEQPVSLVRCVLPVAVRCRAVLHCATVAACVATLHATMTTVVRVALHAAPGRFAPAVHALFRAQQVFLIAAVHVVILRQIPTTAAHAVHGVWLARHAPAGVAL